ncbi:MAG TPA: cache domain-containing protein [Candidatus Sulfotelmatobacter sp.]|nr:cache domain-containing protein [Candidatus Sulfotelmatobacter sp.]
MNVLNRLKVRMKLGLVLAVCALSLIAALGLAASFQRQHMMEERIGQLRAVVDAASTFAQSLENEVTAGKLTHDAAIERFRDVLGAMHYGNGSGYLIAYTMDGTAIAHGGDPKMVGQRRLTAKDANGKLIVSSMIDIARSPSGEGTTSYVYPKPGQTEPLPKVTLVKRFDPWNVFIATGLYVDDVDAEFRHVLVQLGLTALALISITAGIVFAIGRNIGAGLGRLRDKMAKLAEGDLEVDVTESARADEIGDMAKTVQVFRDNAVAMRAMQAEQEAAKERSAHEKQQLMASLADDFESRIKGIVEAVSSAAGQMQSTARSMSNATEGTRQRSLAVASASNQATANVQTVAAASEELSSSISEIGRQVAHASGVSRKAAEEGEKTNQTVSGLADGARRIGEVVKLINDIAQQTNLLALNATIEAARAGDAGKGFAVVASEVKNLASQTARATEEIRGQITAIQAETESAVETIQGISTTILEVNQISASIAAAVEQQAAATQEITRNVQQAAGGTQDVSQNIAGVSASVEETGSAANDVSTAADHLAEQARALSDEVDNFLATVRAA